MNIICVSCLCARVCVCVCVCVWQETERVVSSLQTDVSLCLQHTKIRASVNWVSVSALYTEYKFILLFIVQYHKVSDSLPICAAQ